MTWKKLVREYFTYNKREKRGLSVLLFLILASVLFRLVISIYPNAEYQWTKEQLEKIKRFETSISDAEAIDQNKVDQISAAELDTAQSHFELISFDPNEVSADFLVQAGLNQRSAKMLNKYVNAGGKIRSTDDLLKVYFMDTAWVDSLSDYFDFPEKETPSYEQKKEFKTDVRRDSFPEYKTKKKLIVSLDINTADSVSLINLPGLGPFYAKEIIRLREKLGGIRDYSQLSMIYKMSEENIDRIADVTFIDPATFSYININEVKLDRLGRHPYIKWKEAKTLLNYRFQHGPFLKLEDIKKCGVISDSTYLNLAPYLILE